MEGGTWKKIIVGLSIEDVCITFGLGVEAGSRTLFINTNVSSEMGFMASNRTTRLFGLYRRKGV